MRNKKIIIVFSVLAIIAFSVVAMNLLASMKEEPKMKPNIEKKRYVNAVEVKYQKQNSQVSASGRVSSNHNVALTSEVQGRMLAGAVPLKAGQSFVKGQLLIRIFDEEAQLSLQSNKSRFLNSIANLLPDFKIDYAESYNNWERFFESIDIKKPLPELPEIKSKQEKIYLAGRNILSDYYTIKSAEIRLTKYKIFAPFTGAYTNVQMELGSFANPGTRIAEMIRTDQLEIEIPVDASSAEWINTGDKVVIKSDSQKQIGTGTIVRKANFVNPKTQSVTVYAAIDNSSKKILQGAYVKVYFNNIPVDNSMEIPRSAVFNTNEVFTVVDGKLKKEEISVKKVNENTILFNGLKEGSLVVSEALINANENMKVEVLNK